MNVSNCPRCGKMYYKNVKNLCPDCIKEEDNMYDLVYRYLRDNPRCSVVKVTEATGVPEERVLAFLREGRVQAAEWSHIEYPCEVCGVAITAGRLCDSCTKKRNDVVKDLSTQVKSVASSEAAERDRFGYHSDVKRRP